VAELFNVTMRSPDPVRLGRFWAMVLGYPIDEQSPDPFCVGSTP
jgi:hypothetical protein